MAFTKDNNSIADQVPMFEQAFKNIDDVLWKEAGCTTELDYTEQTSITTTNTEEQTMRIAKEDIPVRINAPGAVARQKTNFGDATGYGRISGEYFSLGAGTDISPLLEGLEGDLCQSPHWGYLLQGKLTVTYADGTQEKVKSGDLFYWPPGHTVKVGEEAEVILFSPQDEHSKVIDHMLVKMGA